MRILITTLLALLITAPVVAAPTIGTASAEVRDRDERIDVNRTIDALEKLGVNTFYYLVWQNAHDWDDLPAFADAAREKNIEVWVYIVPWSETPPHKQHGWGFSEPFKNDYMTWAQEIARLSLKHPNIVGYVIDDFYDNTHEEDRFTPNFVRRMVGAARRINPKIKFFPMMYFQTPWAEFTSRFASIVDGVVICYPKSEGGIRNANTYLRDKRHGPSAIVSLTRKKGAARGDGATISTSFNITDPDNAEISFYCDVTDDIDQDTSLQEVRVRIDGKTVWQAPTEGRQRDGVVNIDLSQFVHRRGKVRMDLEVLTIRTGVPELLPVVVRFDDIRVYGAGDDPAHFLTDFPMKDQPRGKFDVTLAPGSRGGGKFDIPVVLMPTGEGEQYQKRYDSPGTPQAVAGKLRLSLDMLKAGLADGVVCYRTPLNPNAPMFQAVRREFDEFSKSIPVKQ